MTFIKLPDPRRQEALDLLGRLPLLSGVRLEMLLERATLGQLKEGEAPFRRGQSADYWFLLLSGRIDTLRHGIDGEERVIQHVGPGQLLAPIVMFMPKRQYPVDACAVEPCELCRMRREDLHRACLAQPLLAMQMLELAGIALSSRIDDVDSLAGCSASQRLAAYLLELQERQGARLELPLSQKHLAAKLGIRAETLNRMLAEWQRHGYLSGQRRHWQLTAPGALAGLARGNPGP